MTAPTAMQIPGFRGDRITSDHHDYNDHHKHSFYLVLNAGLPGFSHRELAMIALLVRAHRKGTPSLGGPSNFGTGATFQSPGKF